MQEKGAGLDKRTAELSCMLQQNLPLQNIALVSEILVKSWKIHTDFVVRILHRYK